MKFKTMEPKFFKLNARNPVLLIAVLSAGPEDSNRPPVYKAWECKVLPDGFVKHPAFTEPLTVAQIMRGMGTKVTIKTEPGDRCKPDFLIDVVTGRCREIVFTTPSTLLSHYDLDGCETPVVKRKKKPQVDAERVRRDVAKVVDKIMDDDSWFKVKTKRLSNNSSKPQYAKKYEVKIVFDDDQLKLPKFKVVLLAATTMDNDVLHYNYLGYETTLEDGLHGLLSALKAARLQFETSVKYFEDKGQGSRGHKI